MQYTCNLFACQEKIVDTISMCVVCGNTQQSLSTIQYIANLVFALSPIIGLLFYRIISFFEKKRDAFKNRPILFFGVMGMFYHFFLYAIVLIVTALASEMIILWRNIFFFTSFFIFSYSVIWIIYIRKKRNQHRFFLSKKSIFVISMIYAIPYGTFFFITTFFLLQIPLVTQHIPLFEWAMYIATIFSAQNTVVIPALTAFLLLFSTRGTQSNKLE